MKDIRFGNMLDMTEGILVHGCNAQGVMASGIAKDVRAMYPKNYEAYHAYCKKNGAVASLGGVVYFPINHDLMIANAITQLNYGRDSYTRYVNYEAIQSAFRNIADVAVRTGKHVHYPMIGAGLGNGEWSVINELIDLEFSKCNYHINRTLWIFQP